MNKETKTIPSSISLAQFANAMAQQDFTKISNPDKRRAAIIEHYMRIMADTVTDSDAANELRAALAHKLGTKT